MYEWIENNFGDDADCDDESSLEQDSLFSFRKNETPIYIIMNCTPYKKARRAKAIVVGYDSEILFVAELNARNIRYIIYKSEIAFIQPIGK